MHIEKIKFPALLIDKKGFLFPINNNDDLHCWGLGYVDQKFLKGITVIDSNGYKYTIEGFNRVGLAPIRYWINFLDICIRVKFSSLEPETITIDEFKTIIINAINRQRALWSSGGDVKCIYKELEKQDSIGNLMKFVIDILTKNYNKK